MTSISWIGKLSSEKLRPLPKVTQLLNSSTVVCLTPAFLPPQKAAFTTQFVHDPTPGHYKNEGCAKDRKDLHI